MRIHELGKELNIESKAIIGFLSTKGLDNLTSANAVPENMIQEIRDHFTPVKGAEKKSDAPKAVALPDYIVKKVEAEARAAEEKEVKAQKETVQKVEKPRENQEPKKKKIIAVFNPQHASSDKAKAIAKQQKGEQNAQRTPKKKPGMSQRIPARDRIPDDEKKVKRPLPSQLRPARDRIPDDELIEMKKAEALRKEQEEIKAREEAEAKALEEARAREEIKRQAELKEKEKEKETEIQKTEEIKIVHAPKETPKINITEEKPKESEAVKSLREKIVKGTVSVSDLQIGKRGGNKKEGERQQNKKREDKPFGQNKNRTQNQGQQKDRSGGMQGQGRDTRGKTRNDSAQTGPVITD